MDHDRLREALRPLVLGLAGTTTHQDLPSTCESLGLPSPEPLGSKRERLKASFATLQDQDLARVAGRFLDLHPLPPGTRNALQDMLWEELNSPEIPRRFRRELAKAIEVDDLYLDSGRFESLLGVLWILEDDPFISILSGSSSLREEIQRHVFRNPGDWTVEELFDRLGAFEASDRRFALFLEGLSSSSVRPDEASQRRFVASVNQVLQRCGVELREAGEEGGYPIFSLVSNRTGIRNPPKNIIFASPVKPDIRFRDAINNDIEIVSNADRVLVYDKPIGAGGLTWRDLQAWWREQRGIQDDEEAKKTLYKRLWGSLPTESPPQHRFFETYFRVLGSVVPSLPALLPEVWLHWDPRTVVQRGPEALLRFRMDFLLLLPNGVRVVVEVDGSGHYADENGVADPTQYARMVAADRDLKLAGYEVFRFGGHELQGSSATETVKAFCTALFTRYGVAAGSTVGGSE